MSDVADRLTSALRGRYRVERELGQGGMAVVFLAEDLKHNRRVAVKVLRPELAQAIGGERFLKEIAISAQLTHPHILPLHDSGEAGGLLYYVMPYVEGESLRDRLERERQLPVDEAIEVLKEVAGALSHAHSRGIVHRDIKPENILLAAGHALISDFGIARAVDAAGTERLTETGLAVGTPGYMSPEQAGGAGALDGRSDIYSLGCLAYEMLGGEPPFTGPSPQAVLARHTLDPVPPLRTLRPTVAEGLEQAIGKALAKVPADRFATATQFAEALERGVTAGVAARLAVRARSRTLALAAGLAGLVAVAGWLIPKALARGGGRSADIRSLAVLPLENLSGDPEQEYFVAGMHDALIGELAGIGALRVISRRTMLRYQDSDKSIPEIARELNVSGVLEGSVTRTSDQVRLRVALMRALPEEENLWVETYDRGVEEVLTIHTDVARAVARRVGISLGPVEAARLGRPRQVNPEVYEAYLRGMFHLGKPGLDDRRRGLEYLHQAVEGDPGNALAYAGLAMGYAALGHDDNQIPDALPRARAAALRAVTLDSNLAEAQAALAEVKQYYERDWDGAERAFRRALGLNPNLAMTHYHYSWYLILFDHVEEAIAEHKRAQELDPLTLLHTSDLSLLYSWVGRFDDALREAEKSLERDPDFPRGLWALGVAYAGKGMFNEAIAAHERMVGLAPRWRWALAVTYVRAGRAAEARRIAAQLEQRPANSWDAIGLAYIYAVLGDNDAAFRWLAYDKPHAWVPWFRNDPWAGNLRRDPRFAELMRRMNVPMPSRLDQGTA